MKCQLEGKYSQAVLDFLEKSVGFYIFGSFVKKREYPSTNFPNKGKGKCQPFS